jgi:hypothetical protein
MGEAQRRRAAFIAGAQSMKSAVWKMLARDLARIRVAKPTPRWTPRQVLTELARRVNAIDTGGL